MYNGLEKLRAGARIEEQDRKAVATALKAIYTAVDAKATEAALTNAPSCFTPLSPKQSAVKIAFFVKGLWRHRHDIIRNGS